MVLFNIIIFNKYLIMYEILTMPDYVLCLFVCLIFHFVYWF